MRIFARFYRFYLRVCVNVYFSYLMRLKRKFNIKSGLSARFCIYTKKKHPRNLCESVLNFNIIHMKKHISSKSAAKVRKFYFITKFSSKKPDFAKPTLQNYKICI